jgi:hypothetical protein
MPYVPRPAATIKCAHCKKPFLSNHASRKYCSNSCNVLASYERTGYRGEPRASRADLERTIAKLMELVNVKPQLAAGKPNAPKPAAKAAATTPTKKPAAKAAVKQAPSAAPKAAKAAQKVTPPAAKPVLTEAMRKAGLAQFKKAANATKPKKATKRPAKAKEQARRRIDL